jgi:hypothetical protein
VIAVAHPGKLGDALYALPSARKLAQIHNCKVDFYTSEYCAPMKNLVEKQSYINKCIISEDYVLASMDMGCQPPEIPIDASKYEKVYQCGFKAIPDRAIHQYIAHTLGIEEELSVNYDLEQLFNANLPTDYITIAPRGYTSYLKLFMDVADLIDLTVVLVGGNGDAVPEWNGHNVVNCTGMDMLATAYIIKNSKGFVGLMSSQLVLANGFPIPKVAPHNGINWDMRHVIYSEYNHYPVDPTAEEVIKLLGYKGDGSDIFGHPYSK